MNKMAEVKYMKGAGILASRYLFEGKGGAAVFRGHAMAAIEKMGVPAVPYLIDYLHGPTGRYTGMVLTKLTGTDIEAEDMKKAREWWESHKPGGAK